MSTPAAQLEVALRVPARGPIALVPQIVAGYPRRDGAVEVLEGCGRVTDALIVVVPFSDPLPDGIAPRAHCLTALHAGATLRWVFSTLDRAELERPVVLASHLNPLLAYGQRAVVRAAAEVGVSGLLVPDLSLEERAPLLALCEAEGLALVPTIAASTTPDRLRRLAAPGGGFAYAVGEPDGAGGPKPYLDRVRAVSALPVAASLDVRTREHVAGLVGHADAVIVGPALADVLVHEEDPAAFLDDLLPDELGDPVPTEVADLPPR